MSPLRPSSAPLRPCAIALGVLAALAGCGDGSPGPGPSGSGSGSAPGAIDGRPIVATARGPAVAGELVVTLVPGAGEDVAAELAAEVGGRVTWHGPRTGAYLIRFDGGEVAAARALPLLAARPEVLESTRNVIASGSGIGTSPSNAVQWNLAAMGLDPAGGFGGAAGVTIAVLDTGVAYENFSDDSGTYAQAPDLAGVSFAPGYDFVYDDAHPDDDEGHGTHVTGIMAQTGPLTAVAPGATILPVKVLGPDDLGTELTLAEGVLYAADHGADVVNMSLSFSPAYFPSRLLQDAFDQADASGVVLVAASGNHGAPVVTYPAAFRNVIAVGASTLDPSFRTHPSRDDGDWHGGWQRRRAPGGEPGSSHAASGAAGLAHSPWLGADRALEVAPYSDHGWLLDVTAPGGSIDQDVDGDGNPEAILAQSFVGDPTQFQYVYYAGTSQAAAQVSGLAADMLAANPGLTSADVRAALGLTARGDRRWQPLATDTGRGYVSAGAALRVAGLVHAGHSSPHHFASVNLSLRAAGDGGGGRVAHAVVEVVDGDGAPARHVEVYGTFTGGVFQSVAGRTDRHGRVVFESEALDDERLAAFQVERGGQRARAHRRDRSPGRLRPDRLLLARSAGRLRRAAGHRLGHRHQPQRPHRAGVAAGRVQRRRHRRAGQLLVGRGHVGHGGGGRSRLARPGLPPGHPGHQPGRRRRRRSPALRRPELVPVPGRGPGRRHLRQPRGPHLHRERHRHQPVQREPAAASGSGRQLSGRQHLRRDPPAPVGSVGRHRPRRHRHQPVVEPRHRRQPRAVRRPLAGDRRLR